MTNKFIIFFALVAATKAGYIAPQLYHAPLAAAPLTYTAPAVAKIATPLLAAKAVNVDHDPHPQYSFAYDVQDTITGDYKSQHETRDGDIVQGSYSLLEADGTRRVVDYTADSHNGFNAVVHKESATKVALAAPLAKITTPALTYGAPIPTLTKLATPSYAPVAAYAAPPTISYGTPALAKLANPLPVASYTTAHTALPAPGYAPAYAAPLAKLSTPIASAPVIAKYTPHPYIAHVTYTTPLFSYSH